MTSTPEIPDYMSDDHDMVAILEFAQAVIDKSLEPGANYYFEKHGEEMGEVHVFERLENGDLSNPIPIFKWARELAAYYNDGELTNEVMIFQWALAAVHKGDISEYISGAEV